MYDLETTLAGEHGHCVVDGLTAVGVSMEPAAFQCLSVESASHGRG